jgi:endonuclease/exonuclease/phosphatase family metal-dependent hydrolase
LKRAGYVDFYYNIGASVAVSSGIFVASKVKTDAPRFRAFESSHGVTYFKKKGVFSVNVIDEKTGKVLSRVSATHAQHSEESEFPTTSERRVRQEQLAVAGAEAEREGGCAVLTGDLNCPSEEFRHQSWAKQFDEGIFPNRATWDGDTFSANMVGQRPSSPLILDHTLVKNGVVKTTLVQTGFDSKRLLAHALSDHKGLYSRVRVGGSFINRIWNWVF